MVPQINFPRFHDCSRVVVKEAGQRWPIGDGEILAARTLGHLPQTGVLGAGLQSFQAAAQETLNATDVAEGRSSGGAWIR